MKTCLLPPWFWAKLHRNPVLYKRHSGILSNVKNEKDIKHNCRTGWSADGCHRNCQTYSQFPGFIAEKWIWDVIRWAVKRLVWSEPMSANKGCQIRNEIAARTPLFQVFTQPLSHAAVLSADIWYFMERNSGFGTSRCSDVRLMRKTFGPKRVQTAFIVGEH